MAREAAAGMAAAVLTDLRAAATSPVADRKDGVIHSYANSSPSRNSLPHVGQVALPNR